MGKSIPQEMRHNTRWLELLIQNHQVSFELRTGDREQLKYVAGTMAISIQAAWVKIGGKNVQVGLETSSVRRRAVKKWYEAKDSIVSASPGYKFSVCSRSLQIWDSMGVLKLVRQ